MGKWIDLAGMEKALTDTLSGIADRVFVTHNPTALPGRIGSYLVVSVGGEVSNEGAYKRSDGHVYALVRNKPGGARDSVRMDEVVDGVLGRFPIVTDYFSAISPSVSYAARVGEFSRMIIRFELRIKT